MCDVDGRKPIGEGLGFRLRFMFYGASMKLDTSDCNMILLSHVIRGAIPGIPP